MARKPWKVKRKDHPGSTWDEILHEPDWDVGHEHRVGFKNKQDRIAGITHADDEWRNKDSQEGADKSASERRENKGDLVNFRDLITKQKDYHLRNPKNKSIGWRFVLEATEDWVKNTEEWPANIRKKQKEEEEKAKKDEEKQKEKDSEGSGDDEQKQKKKDEDGGEGSGDDDDEQSDQSEHDWKKQQGQNQHHDAYAATDEDGNEQEKSEYQKLREKYTPQEISLLRALRNDQTYIKNLQENDGKRKSPQKNNRTEISIDEQDQFSPDNWLPRSSDLIRLTGKHPLNAEPHLTHLLDAGLITPNELHYVRNHGAVPRLLWELHKIDVHDGKLTLSMDDLKSKFDPINIAVALACDGNRRKELNMIRRSKGFNWGAGAVSCAFWRGPLLRDVLLAAGFPKEMPAHGDKRYWVNFEGADELSEGSYQTCIPLEYAMDETNDVILAYEMNDVPLPPDHGYPVRLIIPGYVGGRCVKWLRRIWITEKENDSHYHIWDNRVLPAFITDKDGAFADAMFRHPDTACNEQNLNSVIVKPAHGEKIPLNLAKKGRTYRIAGYAYDGGGHEVQRVELSLDDGETWLYCMRRFPDAPIRHGKKFWTWLHWHVDVEITHLLRAKSLTVRCFNVFKNTQPREPNWNIMGMMNNCWYVVRPDIVQDEDSGTPSILFRHPCEPGTGDGGWMKPSFENQIAQTKQEAGTPQKQFTREEIEKHDNEHDCWIVVDGKVYDATSVLDWHPGGSAAILGHAGKVHQATSDEFASIHDDYATKKLKECILGVVTDKAMNFIKKNAEQAAKEKSESDQGNSQLVLQKHRWVPVKLVDRKSVSEDTRTYTFELPEEKPILGLGTCQHIQLGFHMKDRMLIRSYTPTKPLLPCAKKENDSKDHPQNRKRSNSDMNDGCGTFELTVKTYFPDENQPGGAMSNILDCMPLGEEIEIRGPTGEIEYNGNGKFTIEKKTMHFPRVSLILGGSGITPGYSLIARIMLSDSDKTEIRVIDANKTEKDILLKGELDKFEQDSKGQLKVTHVLSHPSDSWKGLKGHVNEDIIKNNIFEPGEGNVVFLCGPPTMIQKAALPALRDWGYKEDENMFGF